MTIELRARRLRPGTVAFVIRLIEALDHRAARIAVGQVLTHIAARHRSSTDLGDTARVLVDLTTNVMTRTAADVVLELSWRGEQPVVRIEDTGPGYEGAVDDATSGLGKVALGLLLREGAHTVEVRSRPLGGTWLAVTPDIGAAEHVVPRPSGERSPLPAPMAA